MTTTTKQAKPEKPAATDFEGIAAFNGMNFEAYAQASQAMLRGFAAINEEIMSFAGAQMRDGAKMSQVVLNTEDFGEAVRLQIKTTRTASDRYFGEANRLLDITARLCRDCSAPLEHRAREVMDEAATVTRK